MGRNRGHRDPQVLVVSIQLASRIGSALGIGPSRSADHGRIESERMEQVHEYWLQLSDLEAMA